MQASYQLTPAPPAHVEASATLSVPRIRVRKRRSKLVFLLVATSLVVLSLLGRNLLEKHLREKVLPSISERLGRQVEVGKIKFGFGAVTLHELRVGGPEGGPAGPFVRVRRAKVAINLLSLFHGEIQVDRIVFSGVRVRAIRGRQGEDNVTDLVRGMMGAGDSKASVKPRSGTGRYGVRSASVSVSDLQLTLIDNDRGARLVLLADELTLDKGHEATLEGVKLTSQLELRDRKFSLSLEASQIRISPDGRIKIKMREVQADSTDPRLSELLANNSAAELYLERVRGQDGSWQINLLGTFAASAGGDELALPLDPEEESFVVSAWLPSSGELRLRVATEKFKLSRLAPLLRNLPSLMVDEALVSGRWDLRANREAVSVDGEMELAGVALDHARLARQLVQMQSMTIRGRARFDRSRGELRVHNAEFTSAGVPYQVSLELLLPGFERADHPAKRLSARVTMPEVPCQDMLTSLPSGLAPNLQSFELEGQAQGDFGLMIDWQDFDLTQLDTNMNLDKCRVVSAPTHMSAARLQASFEHRVPVPGGFRSFVIGPENPDFVPLRKVSQNLKRSFLTTEDSGFYRHEGFITKEFRGALIKNLKRGRFAYGASSISMQVVKNVLLSREKTVSRKLQELFLTWHLENALGKERILEIYVNAIEFGPGLYGIKPAARQYFSKHPRALNPVESAFLSSLLPAPSKRYKQYCGGRLRRSTSRKIERILGFMHERHRLDEEQYALALDTPLSFRGRRAALCRQSKPHSEGRNS